ncbi:MAG TPA: kelch repeat-containing protein, partial [Gemmataceae bacterium]|nr:kelch repeat-containing protein [Gemmataceae bacterium]
MSIRSTFHRVFGSFSGRKALVRPRRRARTSARLAVQLLEKRELLTGTWLQLANRPTLAIGDIALGTMLLLPNGSVMVNGEGPASQQKNQSGASSSWYELTPDSTGSYVNGTWTQLPSMNTPRRFFGSVVLPNGQVLIAGGEYDNTSFNATDINTCEM